MKLLLKLKHWHLFLIVVVIPFGIHVFNMISMFTNEILVDTTGPDLTFEYMKWMPLIMVLAYGGLFGWQWAVANKLNKHLPEGFKMNLTRFKIFFFFPLVYMVFFMAFFFLMFSGGKDIFPEGNFIIFFVLIGIFHLFSMFCLIHNIQFIAKSYKAVQLQRAVQVGDYIGEFLLIFFWFVGIWFIQPKINELVEKN